MMKTITVKDLGEVITGNTPPRSKPELYGDYTPFIKATDISETSKYTYEPEECYSEEGYKKYRNSLIPKGATCVVTIGSVGKKMTMAHCDCFINQAMNAIIPNENYDKEYVYYLLKHNVHKLKMLNSGTASGRENVSKSAFSNMELLAVQDIVIQKKIGSILADFDKLIENNQKQINLHEEAAQRLYKEWFVDLRFPGYEETEIVDGVPSGWERKKLVDIVDVQYGFAFDGSKFNAEGKGTPIIRIRNIPDGHTNDFTTEEADEKYIINNGEIVVGMDGEFHINSWAGDNAYLVQRTCCFRPRKQEMNGWLLWAIYEPIKFYEKTVVGATVAHLGKKHIDEIELLVGPDDLYIPFKNIFDKRQNLLNQNIVLSEARDRLLPKLMSGEIEV